MLGSKGPRSQRFASHSDSGSRPFGLDAAILNCGPEQQDDPCNHDHSEENTENEDNLLRASHYLLLNSRAPSERIDGTHKPTKIPCSREPTKKNR